MSKSLPIVIQLQMEAADANVSVSALLRKAKIIATKLDLPDFLEWIDNELNGYNGAVPDYRKVYGSPQAFNPYHGWQPILFENAQHREVFSFAPIGQAIGSLEKTVSNTESSGRLQFDYPPEMKQRIVNALHTNTDVRLILSLGSAHGILDAVRNSLLEWALKLEKAGITGHELSFSQQEKKEAQPVTQQFFAQNIGIVGNTYDQSNVVNNQDASIEFDIIEVSKIIGQIENTLSLLPQEKQNELKTHISEIHTEIKKPQTKQDKGRISSALKSISRVCEGITGNVVAQGIIAMIGKLPL